LVADSLPVFGKGRVGLFLFFSSLLAALADPTPALPEVEEGKSTQSAV
jgi:hypothetical protein